MYIELFHILVCKIITDHQVSPLRVRWTHLYLCGSHLTINRIFKLVCVTPQEPRADQEEGGGAALSYCHRCQDGSSCCWVVTAVELPLNSCFSDTVFVTLFHTAVETAISGVQKLLHTDGVPTPLKNLAKKQLLAWIFIVLGSFSAAFISALAFLKYAGLRLTMVV